MTSIPDTRQNAAPASPEVREWLDQIVAVRTAAFNPPIADEHDPRFKALLGIYRAEQLRPLIGDADRVLETTYFAHVTERPELPGDLDRPAWAETSKALMGEWPEIAIEHKRELRSSRFGITIMSQDTLFAEDKEDPDGEAYAAGSIKLDHQHYVRVDDYHPGGFDRPLEMNFEGAEQLRELAQLLGTVADAVEVAK